jgi:hypothetical protein
MLIDVCVFGVVSAKMCNEFCLIQKISGGFVKVQDNYTTRTSNYFFLQPVPLSDRLPLSISVAPLF